MPIPSSQEIQRPLLEIFKDEAPHNLVINELLELIADKLKAELDGSTEKTAFKNNINEAIRYLLKNKFLSHPTKTTYLITRAGVEFLDGGNIDETSAPEEIQEDNIPVGFDEEENSDEEEIIEAPELDSEQPAVSEISNPGQLQDSQDEDGEINEPEPDEPEDISDISIGNGIESEQIQEDENTAETEAGLNENDDGIDIEDSDDFDDFNENELETVEKIEEQESEPEIKNEESENELENEDLDEMNKTELETANDAVNEMPEEIEEIKESETENIETDDAQNSSEDLSLEEIFINYNENLSLGVLERLENLHQDNFCMLVMDLLSKMDYRVFQTARYTNDVEGTDLIQGIILENKLGMNPIYIHARKLSSSKTVSKAEMLDFVNALSDKGGKGMFITTGSFSNSAEEVAKDEGIMLVDGKKLAGLMISNNFCVNTERVFELKAIDSETFDEYDS